MCGPYSFGVDVLSGVAQSMRTRPGRFFRTRRGPGWGNTFGPYNGAGLHLVLDGACWLIRDSRPPLQLRRGDVLLLPRGTAHGLADRPDARLAALPPDPSPDVLDTTADDEVTVDLLSGAYEVDHRLVHPMLQSLPEVLYVLTGPRHCELRATIDLLTTEVTTNNPGATATRTALLGLVLVYLLRAWVGDESAEHPDTGWAAALADPSLAVPLNLVHEDPAHPWTVDELAGAAGMSKTAFARRFSRTLGQTPLAYVTWWRLHVAARMLLATDDSLARIARDVGYQSQSAFANAFRREMGVYPGKFRTEPR